MIRIGFTDEEKASAARAYLDENPSIKGVVQFTPDGIPPVDLPSERYSWTDIILYKVFYPLLEKIDDSWLILINECLRTQNRGDLTYNCLHHYLRQTPHRMVFERLPFIFDQGDAIILLDKDAPDRYRMRSFDMHMLRDHDVQIRPRAPVFSLVEVILPVGAADTYAAERDKLFASLGRGDPDNLPRRLHVWVGRYKKPVIADSPGQLFAARNARFGLPNVVPFSKAGRGDYILADLPHRPLDLNDFLRRTGQEILRFLSTGLAVDRYYADRTQDWVFRLEDFYDASGLC